MSIEAKHFEMLIDTLNYALRQLYYILSKINDYYDDLENEVFYNIKTIIYPMLCDVSKETGISFQMVRNKWWWNYYDLYYKQITPNSNPHKCWSGDSDSDDDLPDN